MALPVATVLALYGVALVVIGVVLNPFFRSTPDLIVTADGKIVAVRDSGGTLRASGTRAGSYAAQQIFEKERSGQPDAASLAAGVSCDRDACLLTGPGGLRVSHVLTPSAFLEDCRWADVIVTPLPAPKTCATALIIDRTTLQRTGAAAIAFRSGNPAEATVSAELTSTPRPWQRPPAIQPAVPAAASSGAAGR